MRQQLDFIAACPPYLPDGRTLSLEGLDVRRSAFLGEAFSRMDPWARYPYPASQLEAYFAASIQDSPRYGVQIEGQLAGVIGLKHDWLRGPYIQFLGFLPQYQKCGAGRIIMGALERAAIKAGCRNLWVCASDFNDGAVAFYQRLGYTAVAPLPDLVRDGRTELLLRKTLQAAS